ncbi:MAG: PAS domain S-box protein [Betaproteobacteria bacterium]
MKLSFEPTTLLAPGVSAVTQTEKRTPWLRVTLASMEDALVTTDSAGCITFLNPAAQALTGWPLDQARGTPLDTLFKLVDLHTRLPVENSGGRAVSEGAVIELTEPTVLITHDGSERSIRGTLTPVLDTDNQVTGLVVLFHDLSQRHSAQHALEEGIQYGDTLLATLRDPALVMDRKLCIQRANLAFYEMFGVSHVDTEQRLLLEIGDGEWNIQPLRNVLEDVAKRERAVDNVEVTHVFPKLGARELLVSARSFHKVGRHTDLILMSIEDVTERNRAKAALQDSENRYRRLFETAKDGILILDAASGKIIDANPYITHLLGYAYAELLGKELWEIGLLKDVAANQAAYNELQRSGYIRYAHLPLQNKNGERAAVEFVSNAYRQQGRTVIQCNIRDITERNRLEAQTEAQAEQLADLNRRKDEFLAMLSHELRSPLAAIQNALRLLRLPASDDGSLAHQGRLIIERQVGQVTHLVDGLLEMSRITTGRIRLRLQRVDLRGIVGSAVQTAQPFLKKRGHQLSVSVPPHPVLQEIDAGRLEQVLVNLLHNASKYTEEGATINITMIVRASQVIIKVRDNGIGIAHSLLGRIFDAFTQIEHSLDRSEGGLGIGLTLAQRIIRMHGGTIEARSEGAGQGSEFIISLPLRATREPVGIVAEPTDQDEHLANAAPESTSTPAHEAWRILIVDDNIDAADSLALLFDTIGHDAKVAYSSEAALRLAADYRPDFVLLDIGLPGMDGYKVAKQLREQSELKHLRLIALTGYGQERDFARSKEAGFDHHVVKPVEFDGLNNLMASLAACG